MLIHLPEMIDARRISAKIDFKHPVKGIPQYLWFEFPGKSTLDFSKDSDPFAVALLLLAMFRKEPLEVEGTLSRKLFQGLHNYQKVFYQWYPERFSLIDIRHGGLRDDLSADNHQEACAFSGGVDSFYTFLKLLKEPRPEGHFAHGVFMGGFDMPLNLKKSIAALTDSYSEMMEKLGVHFIVGSTNVRNFVNTVDWTNAHGQALAATALFFKKSWKRFYIPSSYTGTAYPKWGTHPRLDHLLSTESMEFVHHGSSKNRVEKLKAVIQFPESYERLRVCWIQDIGLQNCGQCEKCLRTMIALDILGALRHYKTFKERALSGAAIRSLPQRTHQGRLFAKELIKEAFFKGKFKICMDLSYSLLRRKVLFSLSKLR